MKKTATPDELKRFSDPGTPAQDEKPEEGANGAGNGTEQTGTEENPDPVY